LICNQPGRRSDFDDKVVVDGDTDDVDDFRLVVVIVGGGNAGNEEEGELLVDNGTIGDDEEEELPVDGASDNGVNIETVEVLFKGTKIPLKH
jgi:hypothetical protein